MEDLTESIFSSAINLWLMLWASESGCQSLAQHNNQCSAQTIKPHWIGLLIMEGDRWGL